ncbi:MAG TPA: glycosyltransferase 87 family protein [Terriglobales bacterium]|nr:glycosyltransferase 87 family protein [Terriglobales bacterium]
MWSPPCALGLMIPIQWVDLHTARIVALVVSFVIIFLCADWLWQFYGGDPKKRWVAGLLAFSFAPTLACLGAGQMAVLLLAGTTLFLYFSQQRQYLLAGASLLLVLTKPHILYLIWVAILFWTDKKIRWQLLLGAAIATTIATALVSIFEPKLLSEYLQATKGAPMLSRLAPGPGGLLRMAFGWDRYWLQFMPAFLGTAAAIVMPRKWRTMPTLLTLSVATAPYGWIFDQTILLPVLMWCAIRIGREERGTAIRWTASYIAVNAALLAVMAVKDLLQPIYDPVVLLWLVLYVTVARVTTAEDVGAEWNEIAANRYAVDA